ncbi:DUF4062 domain-containing protein [Nocardia sp. Marseille-Q1738]
MERIYTAFVSSTYTDLVIERELLQRNCLHVRTMPLGMEFFPSTGAGQWNSIMDCLKSADFSIFLLAGRYGSIDPSTNISWTHREYRESRKLGKPSIVLMRRSIETLPRDKGETDDARYRQLQAFRQEVLNGHDCIMWDSETDLVTALLSSIGHMKENHTIAGWVRGTPDPVITDESAFSRIVLLVDTTHRYERSSYVGDNLDLHYATRRIIRSNLTQGLATVPLTFTKSSDRLVPFDPANPPALRLDTAIRTGPGTAVLRHARKNTGTAYTVDVAFDPPLRQNEEADLRISGIFPNYRFATADQIRQATADTPLGSRSFDFYSYKIAYPTRELSMKVQLPTALGMTPLGTRHGFHGQIDFFDTHSPGESYEQGHVEIDDTTYHSMTFRTTDPRYMRTYRLAWQLP